MTPFGWALLVGIPLLVLAIVLEGKRQERVHGRPSGRPNLAGAGLLELQKHLQADRRVDRLVEQVKGGIVEVEEDDAGDGKGPGSFTAPPGRPPRRG